KTMRMRVYVDFYVGAFDREAELQPMRHVFSEERLPWLYTVNSQVRVRRDRPKVSHRLTITHERTMTDLPPLPELRFAEIPAASPHLSVGTRFCTRGGGGVAPPPVLLLHGIGANSLHWRYELAGLADRFRLIAWNAPGYLLSDNLWAETPSCRDYADAL